MTTVQRLYNTFRPTHYKLSYDLTKCRTNNRFSGTVLIYGHATDSKIILHSKDLTIDQLLVDNVTKEFIQTDDELTINDTSLGDCTIEISFSGILTEPMHGIYPCFFTHENQSKSLIATQFESHHAREAFPCIDEPEAKATYDLSLFHESSDTALSNMPITETNDLPEGTKTSFATTPRMSSYLLAFTVGELVNVSQKTSQGVDVSIYASAAQSQSDLNFALDCAVRTIEFFEDYFNTPYPLPKCDHIALPDFSSGAMENWGLITYRESCILIDENSAASSKELVASVIGHELSHQWFGNLVTMKWWDDLWLNESFANLMEYIVVDALYPDWHIWNTFASQEVLSALRRDQLSGVQAVHCEVNHPDEISTLFDPSIVYAKGGRLLRMLRAYIGEAAWKQGLADYFKAHAYQNTVGDDLWKCLAKASGKDVSGFMHTWLETPGYPVVSVKTTDSGYELSQQHFSVGAEPTDTIWPLPLGASQSDFPDILDTQSVSFTASHDNPLLNREAVSHFITAYDKAAFALLLEGLKADSFSEIDRLSLLHEFTLLSHTDHQPTSELIPLLETYKYETSESVWGIISLAIGDLKRFVEDDESAEKNLKSIVKQLATPLYEKLGNEEKNTDSEETLKLRATILGLLTYAEYEPVLTYGLETCRESQDIATLPGELRPIFFAIVSKYGDNQAFEALVERHRTTHNPELRDDLVGGLTSVKSPERIAQLLENLTDNTHVKPQDITRWYIYMLRNRYSKETTWQWMNSHWDWIEKTFKGDKSYDDIARHSATVLAGRSWLDAYRTFFEPKKSDPALTRTIIIGMTDLKARTDWIETDKTGVIAALASKIQ